MSELSANHLGSFDRAMQLVEAAAQAGADAIKLQTWSEMVICDYTIKDGPWAGRKLKELYAEAKTPWEWHEPLFERAKELGMEAFSSVFDMKALEFLESIGCPRYKISSFELGDTELLEHVASTGKPIILSTGMAGHEEVERAVETVLEADIHYDLTLLKCSSAYPAPLSEMNLAAIPEMEREYHVPIGFSDHTLGHVAAMTVTALGAVLIEKHLTLRRSDGGPDAAFSAEPAEFYQMVQRCEEVAKCLGNSDLGATPAEASQVSLKRSLYYAIDVSRGTKPDRSAIVSARPGLGLEPYRIKDVLSSSLNRNVKRGEPVRIEDFG